MKKDRAIKKHIKEVTVVDSYCDICSVLVSKGDKTYVPYAEIESHCVVDYHDDPWRWIHEDYCFCRTCYERKIESFLHSLTKQP